MSLNHSFISDFSEYSQPRLDQTNATQIAVAKKRRGQGKRKEKEIGDLIANIFTFVYGLNITDQLHRRVSNLWPLKEYKSHLKAKRNKKPRK